MQSPVSADRREPQGARPPPDESALAALDAWWRAANFLAVGQIYLLDNPLLREPLRIEHTKPRLLGHWGTTPGLNLLYAHLNRLIRERGLDVLFVTGPGHGGPALAANTYLEGTYSELYPDVSQDEEGMRRLFKQFSFPGGIPSHVAPEIPGSINEGGELGYSLAHAYGAVFDNPDLIAACVIGDGEAETATLAASWHSNKFLDPARDGAVLPILHLNGYKIAGPTVLARIPRVELEAFFVGAGHRAYFVEGDDPAAVHRDLATTLDRIADDIAAIQRDAREKGVTERPRWPALVLITPKGWTGPGNVDGVQIEGTYRAHQVPLAGLREHPAHLAMLERWMRGYRPEELFDERGALRPELQALAPRGAKRMGATPHANGGVLLRDLRLPDYRDYAIAVTRPGAELAESTAAQGRMIRDVFRANEAARNFRVFSPDETASNRWGAVFEVTNRCSVAEILPGDTAVARDGRVMEILSENVCEAWLEGYLLTGRHGFLSSYEAFIHIIDAMFNQHAKWLKSAREVPWRRPIASLNILLSSHVLAAGSQRLLASGPGVPRPRGEQEVRDRAGVPAAGREHAAGGHRRLPAQPRSRERDRRRQASRAAVARHGRGDPPCDGGHRHLGLGVERPGRRTGRGDGLLRRRADHGDARRGRAAARARARVAVARRERRGPHAAAARLRASARPAGPRLRLAVHPRPADHLRLPRLSVADPPPGIPPHQSRQPARPRLQGGGHHHHAVRHDRAERHGPLPSGHGRHRPRAAARAPRRRT